MRSRLSASPITSPGNRGILADHPAHWQGRPRQAPLSVAPRRGHAPDLAETPVFLTNHQRLDASTIAAIYDEHCQTRAFGYNVYERPLRRMPAVERKTYVAHAPSD
jgi:hypothetical protein